MQIVFAKYVAIRSKTFSRMYSKKHAKSIAFRGFSTVFALSVVGVHSPGITPTTVSAFTPTTGSANTEEVCEM